LGLWQIETETNTVRQVMSLNRRPHWMGNPGSFPMLIQFSYFTALGVCPAPPTGVVAFDPATDRSRQLYAWTAGRGSGKVESAGIDVHGAECIAIPLNLEPPVAIVKDWLWHKSGFISPDGMNGGVFPPLQNARKTFTPRWRWLQPQPGGRQVLAAN